MAPLVYTHVRNLWPCPYSRNLWLHYGPTTNTYGLTKIKVVPPSTCVAPPSTRVATPSTCVAAPSTQVAPPSTCVAPPSTHVTHHQHMWPHHQHMWPHHHHHNSWIIRLLCHICTGIYTFQIFAKAANILPPPIVFMHNKIPGPIKACVYGLSDMWPLIFIVTSGAQYQKR